MLKIKNLLVAVVVILFATSAMAQTFRIGISGTGTKWDANGSETQSSDTETQEVGAWYGQIFAEAELQEHLSVGISYMPYEISSETDTNTRNSAQNSDSGTNTVQVDIQDYMMLYVMVEIPAVEGVYLKVGRSTADLITNESMGATSSKYADATLDGTHGAIGYAYDTGMGVIVRAEVGLSEYDDISVSSTNNDGTSNTVTLTGLDGPTAGISIVKEF